MKATYILILMCILGYVIMLYSGNADNFINYYGFSGENLIQRPWVIFTSIFVHADFNHLISNVLVLLFFGIALEKEINWHKFLFIFFTGAIIGEFMSLIAYSWNTVGIGASAGIFAIIGAAILMTPFNLSMYPYVIPIPLGILGIIYVVYNIIGLFTGRNSNISYIAHLGGLLFGLFYGFKKRGLAKGVTMIIAISILTLLGIIIASIIFD